MIRILLEHSFPRMTWRAPIRQKMLVILVYRLVNCKNGQKGIRAAGGIPAMGVLMPKSVGD
jgi:hypothetical protein